MSEPLPTTSSTGESIAYQPISGWAIVGLSVSGLFTLMVVTIAIVGWYQGMPVFFPIWTLGFAVAGTLLSYVGQRQIEKSENTRTGIKLARAGLWLGIVSGFGYFSFFYVTGWALETQANSFVMDEAEDSGFFPRIRKGQLDAAFRLTLPAQARPDDDAKLGELYDVPDAKDGAPGKLSQFKNGQLTRLFHQHLGGPETEITPKTLLEWHYDRRSYVVLRNYEIKTKELTAEVHVAVHSSEGDAAGQGRKWYVNMNKTYLVPNTLKLTPVGEGVFEARARARIWLPEWMSKFDKGASFLDIEKKELKEIDKTAWPRFPAQGMDRANFRELLYDTFARHDKGRIFFLQIFHRAERPDLDVGKWEWNQGKVRVFYQFQFSIPIERFGPPMVKVDALAALETRRELDLATFRESSPAIEWNLVSLTFSQATLVSQRGRP